MNALWPYVSDKGEKFNMDRRWIWGPTLFVARWLFTVGVGLYMIKFQGKWRRPWEVRGFSVGIQFDPREWRASSDHVWYDGPNCAWRIGPFIAFRNAFDCDECSLELKPVADPGAPGSTTPGSAHGAQR